MKKFFVAALAALLVSPAVAQEPAATPVPDAAPAAAAAVQEVVTEAVQEAPVAPVAEAAVVVENGTVMAQPMTVYNSAPVSGCCGSTVQAPVMTTTPVVAAPVASGCCGSTPAPAPVASCNTCAQPAPAATCNSCQPRQRTYVVRTAVSQARGAFTRVRGIRGNRCCN